MAKHSFDLPLLPGEEERAAQRAVVLKAILPDDPSETTPEIDPVEEIRSLAETAGVEVVGVLTQKRRRPHGATYVGKGKVEEIAELGRETGAEMILVDDSLSPSQGKNIEERTALRVVDRTELIMDIFAAHARTYQAKLQVELAQLRYSQSRLKRMWTHLSRFEGGIGVRGPGETQLETDRRLIRKKIGLLKARLGDIEQQRLTQHKGRADAFRVALVGYTNAGKSTLMRSLTGARVLVEDQLFSTLDTSTRRWELACPRDVLLSDTVGFIRNLPHSLIASFHATLLEAEEADLLMHVVDCSTPHVEADIDAVDKTLVRIGCDEKHALLLFNKVDLMPEERRIDLQYLLASHEESFVISALEGRGIEGAGGVAERVVEIVREHDLVAEVRLPIDRGDLLARLRQVGTILEEEYGERQIIIRARLAPSQRDRFRVLLAQNGISAAGVG